MMKELSGKKWVSRFQGSTITDTLSLTFKSNVNAFLASLRNGGAAITISATLRPPERAYLMHWSWKIARGLAEPNAVPGKSGVNTEWLHTKIDGSYDREKSRQAAREMAAAYGMQNLRVAPALNSRHTQGNAIDMDIRWAGTLTIKNKAGEDVVIDSLPRDGMNTALHKVGKTFGVIKYHGGTNDKPHWSTDGR